MSSRVNLNDNVEEVFGFTIGGKDYDFKYPTLTTMEPIQELYRKRQKAELDKSSEGVDNLSKIDDELTEKFYELIIPVGHDTPIKEILTTQPLPVVKAFNKMVTDQLAAE